LRALIGRDGHIYDLRPVTAPDTALAGAALLAVRQWTYKPYLLNGLPTEVDTTITVNFNLNAY
jgi:protein TonB